MQQIDKSYISYDQIFILSHNLYFLKEVSFSDNLPKSIKSLMSYWTIKRKNLKTEIQKQNKNFIQSNYEMLWQELTSNNDNLVSIRNTMRRILENFFNLVGFDSVHKIPESLEDNNDKVLARSLCSWINSGSHNSFDDIDHNEIDEELIMKYNNVFKHIFAKTNYIDHYNYMMGKFQKEDDSENSQN